MPLHVDVISPICIFEGNPMLVMHDMPFDQRSRLWLSWSLACQTCESYACVSRNDSLKMFLSDYLKVLDIYYVSFVVKSC